MKVSIEQAIAAVTAASSVTFLTGAGVSTPSGIPDYRSLKGVYQGVAQPEYLLSHDCLENEPETFYQFVKHLYHPQVQPNIIHQKMAALQTKKTSGLFRKTSMACMKKQAVTKESIFTAPCTTVIVENVAIRYLGKRICRIGTMQDVAVRSGQRSCFMGKDLRMKPLKEPFRPLLKPT